MSFTRPTLRELVERTTADLIARLEITTPVPRRAVVRVLSRVYAGAVHSLHGHLSWCTDQLFASSADGDQLDRHGADVGVSRLPGAYATGQLDITGVDDTVVPAGTLWQRSDGLQYRLTTDIIIADSESPEPGVIVCTTAGSDGDADQGTELTIVSTQSGVQSVAVVGTGGIAGGADVEQDDAYRDRILAVKRARPQGGAAADYVEWALSVPGVTRAWCIPQYAGAGSVGVTFVVDGSDPIIPNPAKVDEVAAVIAPLAPVTASVIVFAPAAHSIDIELQLVPDNSAVRAAITAELQDLFARVGEPGAIIRRSQISEAVSAAAGEQYHVLVAPTADVSISSSEIAVLGTLTTYPPT